MELLARIHHAIDQLAAIGFDHRDFFGGVVPMRAYFITGLVRRDVALHPLNVGTELGEDSDNSPWAPEN